MKLSKIAFAVVSLAIGASAMAAINPARIALSSGASATKNNLKIALTNLCTTGGGSLTEFTDGSNISTYVCSTTANLAAGSAYTNLADTSFKNFAGTNFAELRLNVAGGSYTAIQNYNGVADTYRDPAATAAPLSSTTVPANAKRVGGLMDVQPTAFPSAVIGSLTVPPVTAVGIAQTFGVAVSNKLYGAMFNSQKSTGNATIDKPIPSSCAVTDTAKLECVPTISKGQMASIMADNSFGTAYSKGLSFLASVDETGAAVADGAKELRYARRVDTSGTQAAAQNYFLGLPCSANGLSIVPEPTTDDEAGGLKDALIGSIRVMAAPGTGDVRNELNNASNYVIGVISGENNQTGQTWKWLRLQGAPIGENATPASTGITNKQGVINGSYDFYYESVYAATAAGTGFWTAVSSALNTLAAPVGLLESSQLAGYNKGGNTCQFNSSN